MRYEEKDLVRVAKRENNQKRGYLIVNPLQGKHLPVSPGKSLELFSALAESIKDFYADEKLLLVGFAETATAIGAQAAVSLGADYIQTTREVIEGVEYFYFSEEHSHATEQKLVKDDLDAVISEVDRIIFVEDEVTTGKTILNIVEKMEKVYPGKVKFAVASILNGMSKEHMEKYQKKEIPLHYLVKTSHEGYETLVAHMQENGKYYKCSTKKTGDIPVFRVSGYMNTRRLVHAEKYLDACAYLWQQVKAHLGEVQGKRILTVGTEEFMYPALYLGAKLEEMGNTVFCHATTRSPIAVSQDADYPLHARYELRSLYDSKRKTFLYEIGTYDDVFVVTDAMEGEMAGCYSLVNALRKYNQNITLIRWC